MWADVAVNPACTPRVTDMKDRTTNTDDDADHRPPTPGWGNKLTGWLLGVFSGMVITDVSITLGYRGRAAVSAIAAVVGVTVLLRRLDARAPLRKYAPWPLLTSAAFMAAVAAFSWGPGARTPAVVALVLTACAGLLASDPEAAARLLAGAAVIGAGIAIVGTGAAMLTKRDVSVSAAVITAGVAIVGIGVAMLTKREVLADAALAGTGTAVVWVGVAMLASQAVAVGAALAGFGTAVVWVGVAMLTDRAVLVGAALAGAGAAVAGVGAATLANGDVAVSVALMIVGVAILGVAAAAQTNREIAVGAAGIGAAMAAIGIGVAMLASRQMLFSTATIGGAVALAVCGVAIIGLPTVRSAWRRLTDRVAKPPSTLDDRPRRQLQEGTSPCWAQLQRPLTQRYEIDG